MSRHLDSRLSTGEAVTVVPCPSSSRSLRCLLPSGRSCLFRPICLQTYWVCNLYNTQNVLIFYSNTCSAINDINMSNESQLHTKVGQCANDQKQSMMTSPVRFRSSKVKLNPVKGHNSCERSHCSSKIMDRDIKKIKSVIYQKEQPIVLSNLKISKEVTVTSITKVNNTENNVILKLKKLPGITIDLVKSEPDFKVPESPKLKTNNKNKKNTTHDKIKVLFKKNGLSERRYDNIETKDNLLSHNNINISNTNLNPSRILKQKTKQTFNNISLVTKSSDKGIINNPEVSYKKYPVSEKENFQRTRSPKKISKKIQCSSKIKSKSSETIKLVEEISNNCKIFTKEVKLPEKVSNNNYNIFSKEVKTVSDKDTIINNTEFKTNELDNENYMLMDLSTDGQFNIVPASFPLDFINVSVPEYDNFLMGISKSSEDRMSYRSMHLETSQNDTEKSSYNFSDFLGCVNISLNINESNDIHSELASQSFNNGNPLDNIKDKQLCINNKSKDP